jgi:hypothetical protein
MYKKIIVGILLVAATGLLIFGAVNRTLAKTGSNQFGGGNRRGNGGGSPQTTRIRASQLGSGMVGSARQ